MSKKKTEKSSPIGAIITTIIYIVLLVILVFSIIINVSKKDNQISTMFGYAFAVVQSGSMINGGFNVGDMVIIKEVNTDTLKPCERDSTNTVIENGDIIVFYDYFDAKDENVNLTNITEEVLNGTYVDFSDPSKAPTDRKTKQYPIDNGTILIFHRIISIWVDESGTRFFETKGDSNNSADNKLIREDFVCAKYAQSSPVLQSVLSFMATTTGLIVVILIPVGFLIITQIISFSKEMKVNINAIKILERKIRYNDIDLDSCDIQNYFTEPEKVYLYDISPQEDKANLAIILWSDGVNDALEIYENSREDYYKYFYDKFSRMDKKTLKKLQIKADLIHKNPNISEEDANLLTKEILKQSKQEGKETNVNN